MTVAVSCNHVLSWSRFLHFFLVSALVCETAAKPNLCLWFHRQSCCLHPSGFILLLLLSLILSLIFHSVSQCPLKRLPLLFYVCLSCSIRHPSNFSEAVFILSVDHLRNNMIRPDFIDSLFSQIPSVLLNLLLVTKPWGPVSRAQILQKSLD